MSSDGYEKVFPPPYSDRPSIMDAQRFSIDLEAAAGPRNHTADAQASAADDQRARRPLFGFCDFFPVWPSDADDLNFESTASYQRFSIDSLLFGLLFFAPLIAVAGYLHTSWEEDASIHG